MDTKALTEKYQGLVGRTEFMSVLKVDHCNYKPHPYTIGTQHVVMASEHYGGVLGKNVMEKLPCACKGCGLPYKAHVYDTAIFVQLKRDASESEVRSLLMDIKDEMDKDEVDGVVFVDTAEKFRISKEVHDDGE